MEIPASKMDDAIAWNIPLGDLSDWISAQSPWNQTVGYIGPEQTAPSPCAGLGLSCCELSRISHCSSQNAALYSLVSHEFCYGHYFRFLCIGFTVFPCQIM
ncbi:unnamed protein product [Anisakis simplex]|uniref:Uncharacterized protein n=1 Tax=Anisakis simplex TaxID=6269 RepID=A0A0M3J2E1_ANISI|nr:unnamed protein product [Anisakis simplex]